MEAVCCRRQRELAAQKASERHGWQEACVPWKRSSCASAVLTWLSRRAGGCHKAACVLPRLPPPRLRLRMPWPCVAEMQQLVVQILRVGHVAMEQFPPESETGDELAELAMALVSLPVGESSAATAPLPHTASAAAPARLHAVSKQRLLLWLCIPHDIAPLCLPQSARPCVAAAALPSCQLQTAHHPPTHTHTHTLAPPIL